MSWLKRLPFLEARGLLPKLDDSASVTAEDIEAAEEAKALASVLVFFALSTSEPSSGLSFSSPCVRYEALC